LKGSHRVCLHKTNTEEKYTTKTELFQFVSYQVTCSIQGTIFTEDNYKNPEVSGSLKNRYYKTKLMKERRELK